MADSNRTLYQAVYGAELSELRGLLRDPVHRGTICAGNQRCGMRRAVRETARGGTRQGQAEEAAEHACCSRAAACAGRPGAAMSAIQLRYRAVLPHARRR